MTVSYVGKGSLVGQVGSGGTVSVSVSEPASVNDGDFMLLVVETCNDAVNTPSGWTLIDAQGIGVAGSSTATRNTSFYRTRSGSSSISVSASDGDHIIGQMFAFRDAEFDQFAGSTAFNTSSVSFPSVTTTVADTMIVHIMTIGPDASSAAHSGATNANLSSLTERQDGGNTSGNGGGIVLVTGLKSTAGATGNTTGTLNDTLSQGKITLALKPLVAPPAKQNRFGCWIV